MMRYLKIVVMGCLFLLVTLSCNAWSNESVGIEMVKLKTADGISLTGILHQRYPTSNRTGVVMVHGYSGNFYSGIMNFLPKALADLDFTTLAINMRDHDRSPKKNLFEENRLDIAAAVDEMSGRGFNPLFLYGHSMGTNRVLYYLAETHDTRISGALLTGPPGNLFEWNVRMFGKETAIRVLRQAQDLVARGKGDQWMLVNLGPLGKALYTANHLVSLRGPKTVSDPFKNIARISKPILIVHGLSDRLADHTVADQLRNIAASASKVSVIKIA
ncbi:MAG: alpha/beta fold hydrolase, partial [Deltaproteobacteria bacterium]|nr:alpha/beta fold hydrolase [Deltaproteobacteria bacterium]